MRKNRALNTTRVRIKRKKIGCHHQPGPNRSVRMEKMDGGLATLPHMQTTEGKVAQGRRGDEDRCVVVFKHSSANDITSIGYGSST